MRALRAARATERIEILAVGKVVVLVYRLLLSVGFRRERLSPCQEPWRDDLPTLPTTRPLLRDGYKLDKHGCAPPVATGGSALLF